MPLKARKDGNQNQIEKELRKNNYNIHDCSGFGNGWPDLSVGLFGCLNFLFEIKDPILSPSKRKLTEKEIKFFDKWDGQVDVLHYSHEVPEIIKDNLMEIYQKIGYALKYFEERDIKNFTGQELIDRVRINDRMDVQSHLGRTETNKPTVEG